jgi:hypothetical protein
VLAQLRQSQALRSGDRTVGALAVTVNVTDVRPVVER